MIALVIQGGTEYFPLYLGLPYSVSVFGSSSLRNEFRIVQERVGSGGPRKRIAIKGCRAEFVPHLVRLRRNLRQKRLPVIDPIDSFGFFRRSTASSTKYIASKVGGMPDWCSAMALYASPAVPWSRSKVIFISPNPNRRLNASPRASPPLAPWLVTTVTFNLPSCGLLRLSPSVPALGAPHAPRPASSRDGKSPRSRRWSKI